MSFFKQFPKIDYDFRNSGTTQKMTDIYRSIRVLPNFLDQISGYKFYEIINGERPDIVSQRLYGTSNYYWTFFVVNDFLHDGYRAWPMSQEQLSEYIATQYEGYVITTDPVVINLQVNNSIVGKFNLGETITGATSGATGTLTKKNIDMNQLVIQNVTGAFIGDPTLVQNTTESILGSTSSDSISTYQAFKYVDAPYYYYNENDVNKRPVTNAKFIPGGTPESDLAYQTYRDYEFELNEERSKIRYIDPNYIEQFVNDFEELLNE
jgi:hypothetical protein